MAIGSNPVLKNCFEYSCEAKTFSRAEVALRVQSINSFMVGLDARASKTHVCRQIDSEFVNEEDDKIWR